VRIFKGFPQGSMEWLAVRAGIITASEFKAIVTPKWKISDSKGVDTYLNEKLAEKWLGAPPPAFQSGAMEQGSIREDEAIPFYELNYGEKVDQVALVTSDDLTIGCSPDGLLGDEAGLELKCPEAATHVGYLLANAVPEIYLPQIHFSLYVTGRKLWRFMSYRPAFPALVLTVERDESKIEIIEEATANFLARFNTAWECLVNLNGGEAPAPNPFRTAALQMEHRPLNASGSDAPATEANCDTPP
jgi:predicted phage-related endonuclease